MGCLGWGVWMKRPYLFVLGQSPRLQNAKHETENPQAALRKGQLIISTQQQAPSWCWPWRITRYLSRQWEMCCHWGPRPPGCPVFLCPHQFCSCKFPYRQPIQATGPDRSSPSWLPSLIIKSREHLISCLSSLHRLPQPSHFWLQGWELSHCPWGGCFQRC